MTATALEPAQIHPPAATYVAPQRDDELRLRGIVNALLRRQRLIGAVTISLAALVAVILMLQPDRYQATALAMIKPGGQQVVEPQQELTDTKPDSAMVDSEVEVLTSRAIAWRLARQLNLANDPAWNPGAPNLPKGQSAALTEDTVARVQNAIDARRRGLTDVVAVTVTAPRPAQAELMANTLISLLGQMQVEAARVAANRANAWLQQRLESLRQEVHEKDAAVEAYRAQNGLLTADGVTLAEKQIDDVQTAALQARSDLADKTARYSQARAMVNAGGSPDSIAGVLTSNTIRDLRAKEADIAGQQADAEKRYGDLNPKLQDIQAQRADIDNQIQAETQRILASLKSDADAARARVAAMEGNLASARRALQTNDSASVKLDELQHDADAARAVFASFLQRAHEISDQGSLDSTAIRLVSPAVAPTAPSFPRPLPVIAIALAIGLGAALLSTLLIDQFDESVDSGEDIEQKLGARALLSIPAMTRQTMRRLPARTQHPAEYIAQNPMSGIAEAFRVLRASIVYDPNSRPKLVAVTSALPGEGKTTSSLCLARIAAMSGEKVILIDCDLRRRGLNDLLDIAPNFGLLEVLSGERDWISAVGCDEASGAHVLPVRPSEFTPRDVFGSPAMTQLVADLSSHYDMIILDCAPVLAVAETRALAAMADATILIARWRKTPMHALTAAMNQLESAGARVTGVAVNRVDVRAPGRSPSSDSLYYSDVRRAYYSA